MYNTNPVKKNNTNQIISELRANKKKIIDRIEFLVNIDGLSYVEAMMMVCEENEIEPEDLSKYISGPIKHKVENEARLNHNLKKEYCKSNTMSLF